MPRDLFEEAELTPHPFFVARAKRFLERTGGAIASLDQCAARGTYGRRANRSCLESQGSRERKEIRPAGISRVSLGCVIPRINAEAQRIIARAAAPAPPASKMTPAFSAGMPPIPMTGRSAGASRASAPKPSGPSGGPASGLDGGAEQGAPPQQPPGPTGRA